MSDEIRVRVAREQDVTSIRTIFELAYDRDYPFRNFFDDEWLKRAVYADDIYMLVAEEEATGQVLGTASITFDAGTHSDLLGEFGRLAVHPEARRRGVGHLLMQQRLAHARGRLQVGIVDNRTAPTFSQRISLKHGFAPVGLRPLGDLFRSRESTAMFAGFFAGALELRRNHPRVIPEAHALASLAMTACGLEPDAIIDEESAAYPTDGELEVETLTAAGMPALLRIERGRVRHREIFGPARLHHGRFLLRARHATYLIARRLAGSGAIAGAVGYIHNEIERNLRIFELIAPADGAIRPLLGELLRRADSLGVEYIEVDVSADAPRMQRTLLELGFLPAVYIPAMVFHEVERLDVVKMAHLRVPPDLAGARLAPEVEPLADAVFAAFAHQPVKPAIARAVNALALFTGLNQEQTNRLAGACTVARFAPGTTLYRRGEAATAMYILIDGEVEIRRGDEREDRHSLDAVGRGEVVGERALLCGERHGASATATAPVVAAALSASDLAALTRQRPDIGVVVYRNLAAGLGRKLCAASTAR